MGETAGQPVDKAWVSGVQANRPKKKPLGQLASGLVRREGVGAADPYAM